MPSARLSLLAIATCVVLGLFAASAKTSAPPADCFDQDNLVAWCIVPFDAKKRSPAERSAMLKELGLKHCAYDWRQEHVGSFEEEIRQYQAHGINMFAFWGTHPEAFALFEKYQIHPQIWQTAPSPEGADDAAKVVASVQALSELARETQKRQLPLGLYNHGGWGGDPKNLVAVCEALRKEGFEHVGIVYNFHHGHDHIQDWPESLALMQPYLLCLNINGMNSSGTPKILGIGKGEHDRSMLQTIRERGYQGRIGILNHREELDAREGLKENLDGLAAMKKTLPQPRLAQDLAAAFLPGSDFNSSVIDHYLKTAAEQGDVQQGATLFSSAKLACLQCHKVGELGGGVGPNLSELAPQRAAAHLLESVIWPRKEVKPEYTSWNFITEKGEVLTGYVRKSDDKTIELFQPATGATRKIPKAEIEEQAEVGTLMPEGLLTALSEQERLNLFRFLLELGRTPAAERAVSNMTLPVHAHQPAKFPIETPPLRPEDHQLSSAPINENRMYDFYAKQANYFRTQSPVPPLLIDYPGLNGGALGHWGKRGEKDWESTRWNDADHGSLVSGVFRYGDKVIPRGICVNLGEQGELSVCFNPETVKYEVLWKDGFVSMGSVRFGFMEGVRLKGTELPLPAMTEPEGPRVYQGLYRHGKRVVLAYRIGDIDYLDAPWVNADGTFTRELAPVEKHSLRDVVKGGPSQWPQKLVTGVQYGNQPGYAIDTIEVPFENPWRALFYFGGIGFLSDGSAMLCTMQGDVWKVTGFNVPAGQPAKVTWKRYATGLHQALGLVVADDVTYVLGRDMITRLHDRNGDDEADFYECFSMAYVTSAAGHDFICGLERDKAGNFYIASGNEGLVKISPDGKTSQVIATGFRNPDGLGILPDGRLTLPCSEGDWTPASMVCAAPSELPASGEVPHYGYRGPVNGKQPSLPLLYLPRGLDNSSGGQVFAASNRWGPMQNHLLHFSYGTGTAFLVLEDEVNGQKQGTAVVLPGDYRSGAHRGAVNPADGQVYVAGMNGWTCFTPDDGSFQRLRYTGTPTQVPVGIHSHENGVAVEFALPVDPVIAKDLTLQFAQAWNYRYSRAYGSPEFSTRHPGVRGHDHFEITSVQILPDGKTVFLEIPDLQPVNQLHLQLEVNPNDRRHDLICTIHALDRPFTQFKDYKQVAKTINPHPILRDMDKLNRQIPNPWKNELPNARAVTIDTNKNLTFKQATIKAKAGETLKFTLRNPDVVPHNWALLKPGTLQKVGDLTNGLIADPEAYLRHYVPQTDDVIVYTDIVEPGERFTVFFQVPKEPGRYPYLCTFPGHWMVMNGMLIVE